MGLSTVITSGKGGVGKSTVTVGLGRALARRGRRVLLVDCDAGLRSLDRMTGVEERLVYDCADVVRGRCAPAEAIYPCGDSLFLLPAPSSGEDLVPPEVMAKLVPLLSRYYDHVLLDSPAGVGRGFRAAVCAADRAVLVCIPDPVSVRSAGTAANLLRKTAGDIPARLLINRLNSAFFRESAFFADLDQVIDETGVRLLGLVPEDLQMAGAFQKGGQPPEKNPAALALSRTAARLEGEDLPLAPQLLR